MPQNLKLLKQQNIISSNNLDDLKPTHSKNIHVEIHQFDVNNSTIESLAEAIRRLIKDGRLTGKFTISYNLGNVSGATIEISSSS